MALAHSGRIFKTLHVLSYIDAEPYRRYIKRMRNLQEQRHGLAKHVFHGRKGELYRSYHDGMEDQLGTLGLVINCITLWNTVYLDRILQRLREAGHEVRDEDVAVYGCDVLATGRQWDQCASPWERSGSHERSF